MRIALAGNPNSGKTTMYNALTGRNEKVGNWAGVTVEKKEHPIKKAYCKGGEQPVAVDLPGAYSMSPFTGEESITSSYVRKENPDVIINIVDATNLSRSLFFTTQLLELGIPVVVALNKSDINKKKDNQIDSAVLSQRLCCAVIETTATKAEGLRALVEKAVEAAGKGQSAPFRQADSDVIDKETSQKADRRRFDFVESIVKEVEQCSFERAGQKYVRRTDFIFIIGVILCLNSSSSRAAWSARSAKASRERASASSCSLTACASI